MYYLIYGGGNYSIGSPQKLSLADRTEILSKVANLPIPQYGYGYMVDGDNVELFKFDDKNEPQAYTAEQLSAMTNAELSAILAEMGISGSMTKANMIALILDKQSQT